MILHWHRVDDGHYRVATPVEIVLERDDDGAWQLHSSLAEHRGVGYLGVDRDAAMHLTVALLDVSHGIEGWSVDSEPRGDRSE